MTELSLYSTIGMMEALQSLRGAPRFLQDTFFPYVQISDTAEIAFDTIEDELRLAPYVSPLAPGKPMKQRGYQTDKLAPAYVKPFFALDPTAPLRRVAGEEFGGKLSPLQREAIILSQGLEDQRDMVTRRVEVMCADIIKTGKIVISGEDYATVEVDFGRNPNQTVELEDGAQWGETGVSAYDDIEEWASRVGIATGGAVTDVVIGKGAWKLLKKDESFQASLDREHGQDGDVKLAAANGQPGTALYRGTDGTFRYWGYNDQYKNDAGTLVQLFDDYSVSMIASGAAVGTQGYGAIIDPNVGYQSGKYVPKSWLENNPGRRFLMTQSAPLPFFGRINATLHARVRQPV